MTLPLVAIVGFTIANLVTPLSSGIRSGTCTAISASPTIRNSASVPMI